jgi:hypothetical protein
VERTVRARTQLRHTNAGRAHALFTCASHQHALECVTKCAVPSTSSRTLCAKRSKPAFLCNACASLFMHHNAPRFSSPRHHTVKSSANVLLTRDIDSHHCSTVAKIIVTESLFHSRRSPSTHRSCPTADVHERFIRVSAARKARVSRSYSFALSSGGGTSVLGRPSARHTSALLKEAPHARKRE